MISNRRGKMVGASHMACTLKIILVIVCISPVTASDSTRLERVSMRLSYLSQQERLTRRGASADAPEFSSVGVPSVTASVDDTLLVQASCVHPATADVAHAQQAFLRLVRKDTGADSIYVMRKKSIESRAEIVLKKEIRSDRSFWAQDATYRVEVVVGDTRMESGVTWVAIESLTFSPGPPGPFSSGAPGVFDFDVGVKRKLLPEFSSQPPAEEKQAPFVAVLIALIALLAPFPLVLVAWGRLGVFPFSLPDNHGDRTSVIGFEACLVGHMVALTMFWLQWNIVFTWKVMGVVMVPTLIFGHRVLSSSASREVSRRSRAKAE